MKIFLNEIVIEDGFLLKIRKLEDAEAFFEVTDRNRAHLREWLGWLDSTTSPENTRQYIQKCIENRENGTAHEFGMLYQGTWIGSIGLHRVSAKDRSAEIGYWMDKRHAGRGLMTKAVQALIRHAFTDLDMNRLALLAAVGNTKSRAIPERLGFTQEGVSREAEWHYDHFIDLVNYSLLRSEWNSL